MNNKKAILIAIFSFLFFSIMDASTRYTLTKQILPLETFYTYNKIFSLGFLILLGLTFFGKSFFYIKNKKAVFIRSIVIVTNTISLTFSLKYLTLDIFYSLVFTMPLMTMIFSIFFLKEKINIQKIISVIIGFIGIIIIVHPILNISEINIGLIFAFITALTGSLSAVIVRKYIPNENPYSITFYAFILAFLLGTFLSLHNLTTSAFVIPSVQGFCLLVINSVCTVLGASLFAKAFQLGQAKNIATIQYTQMMWGIIFGYLLFKDIPSSLTILGAALIVIANLINSFTLGGSKNEYN